VSIDLAQFHATFFEESREALDAMEAALLQLDEHGSDPETINTIFRVAHSIKGGSGMFGFSDITSFTHTLETLLDELRSSRMTLTERISNALLQSVDVLRAMIGTVQHGHAAEPERTATLHAELTALVKGAGAEPAPAVAAPKLAVAPAPAVAASAPVAPVVVAPAVPVAKPQWAIRFKPLPELLSRGNDPIRLFSELGGLGTLEVTADLSALPAFDNLDAERCQISWDLLLTSDVPRETIDLIFEWAEGDCELTVSRVTTPANATAPALVAPAPEAASTAAVETAAAETAAADTPAVPAPPTLTLVPSAPAPVAEAPAAAVAKPVETKAEGAPAKATPNDAGSIRVGIEKIDELLNTVGEIVITQSMLSQLASKLEGANAERLRSGLAQLENNIRELQESVMRVRMLPVSFVFSRFPRLVRDLSHRLGKQIRLKMTGEQTELDKTVLEKIGDPLVHLVRNSIDHGIEMPDARLAAGKPAEGTVHLNAFHKGGSITLEVSDDGKGLDKERIRAKAVSRGLVDAKDTLTDEQINDLIFLPGFSTAEATTDLSGRGVGMDVVRRNIKELGGNIELKSEIGQGTRFVINLPLTLAIVDGQSVQVGNETYIVPLVAIVESMQLKAGASSQLVGYNEVFSFRGDYLPIIRLHEVFGVEPKTRNVHEGLVMVVEGEGRRAGLFVDELLGQQQVVIKSMESNYGRIEGVGGATILGEGTVALILDVPGLIRLATTRPAPRLIA
jgi:two-component system chemotaxis sensor kinase CheA